MGYSRPTQMLVDEHTVIVAVLDAVEKEARRDPFASFPQDLYGKAFDFFAVFADQCHHAKEEVHLFPLLEARGVPRDGGPIGCMLQEHEQGRQHVAAVRAALQRTAQGDVAARHIVRREALAYVAMLRQHIRKENEILFVIADQVTSPQDKDELWRKFQHAQRTALPPEAHNRYLSLARELRDLGVTVRQPGGRRVRAGVARGRPRPTAKARPADARACPGRSGLPRPRP